MSSLTFKKGKDVKEGKWRCSRFRFLNFRERESAFSLDFQAIGPSDFVGPRRKVVLRSEGYAWALVSWSFDKLREVGVLSYLVYFRFKCFVDDSVCLRP